jgi:hypothetical protein
MGKPALVGVGREGHESGAFEKIRHGGIDVPSCLPAEVLAGRCQQDASSWAFGSMVVIRSS